jgi:hypothetical protein
VSHARSKGAWIALSTLKNASNAHMDISSIYSTRNARDAQMQTATSVLVTLTSVKCVSRAID